MNDLIESTNLIKDFLKVITEFPDAEWNDCLSTGQLDSKIWLIEELEKLNLNLGVIFLLAGWYGTLARFMFNSRLKFDVIRSFDIDDTCYKIAETLNRPYVMNDWQFKATTFDIFDIKYPFNYNTLRRNGTKCLVKETPNTIINTSCEHILPFWFDRIPKNTLLILQSNNFDEIEEHIDCVDSIDMLKLKYPMTKILFSGILYLEKYNRYMLIGYK